MLLQLCYPLQFTQQRSRHSVPWHDYHTIMNQLHTNVLCRNWQHSLCPKLAYVPPWLRSLSSSAHNLRKTNVKSIKSVPLVRAKRLHVRCATLEGTDRMDDRRTHSALAGQRPRFQNVVELARFLGKDDGWRQLGADGQALEQLFKIKLGAAHCKVSQELHAKYKVDKNDTQVVVTITNRLLNEQAHYNAVRTNKPQMFKGGHSTLVDPTDGGSKCDFCKWQAHTAEDTFGRIELEHAVTGSNLFKYAEPYHGIVMFKHHNPLDFSIPQLSDFLLASQLWFEAAHQQDATAGHPFLLWNCMARAGASQYHGHGQLMLTSEPLPELIKLIEAGQKVRNHTSTGSSGRPSSFYQQLLRSHHAVGLLQSCSHGADRAWGYANLTPRKDMEIVVMGSSLTSPAFVRMLHAALRALIDNLGCESFNVGVHNIPFRKQSATAANASEQQGVSTSMPSSSEASSAHLNHSPPGAAAATDGHGVVSSSGSSNGNSLRNVELASSHQDGASLLGTAAGASAKATDDAGHGVGAWHPQATHASPVFARVVSRGKMSQQASDFGGLEVFGGASIGHTDPYAVVAALTHQLGVDAIEPNLGN